VGGDILGQLAVDAFARRANPERAVKFVSRPQWKGGFGAHSGPSRGDPRKRGFRPKRRFSLDVHLVIMRLSEWRSLSTKTPAADNNASHQRGVRFPDHVQKPRADSMFAANVISSAIANNPLGPARSTCLGACVSGHPFEPGIQCAR
jgi:hypothetical protein